MGLVQPLKTLVRSLAHRFGYAIRNLDEIKDDAAIRPYVHKHTVGGHTFSFWIANRRGRRIYGERIRWDEAAEPKGLLALIRPKDRILEVGCNLGFFTMLLGRALSDRGRVVAVDAVAANIMICQAQIELNRLGGTCTALHAALSDRPGTVTIDNISDAHVLAPTTPGGTRVPATTIDELDAKHGPFDALKIDVEGYEGRVLAGATKTLRRRPKLALEIHGPLLARYGSSVEDLFRRVGIKGYEGAMIYRADTRTARPFDPKTMRHDEIVNLLLRPKG